MITQFEIVNPIPIRTKPHFNRRGELVIPNIATQHYNWYLEVAKDNTITSDREYYILFGHNKFDHNCIKLYKDYGRRFVVNLHGEIADFVHREIMSRGNVDVNYLYSEDKFDVWQIE